jgi:stress response protein SCP2
VYRVCSLLSFSSQPYVKLYIDDKLMGKTDVVYKNLNPVWDQSFKFNFNTDESNRMFAKFKNGQSPKFKLHIFDHDDVSDHDDMGTVQGSLSLTEAPSARWLKVEISPGKSKPVTGEIEIKTAVSVRKLLTAVRGNSIGVSGGAINVLLNWQLEGSSMTDLDTSCVAVAHNGSVLMDETVYFNDLENSNKSIRHSGDAQSGGGKGEVITCELDRIKRHVKALYFILTIATPGKSFEDVKSASVSVVNTTTQCNLCEFTPSLVGDNTAMFLMRIARDGTDHGWTMTMIEETDHTGMFIHVNFMFAHGKLWSWYIHLFYTKLLFFILFNSMVF